MQKLGEALVSAWRKSKMLGNVSPVHPRFVITLSLTSRGRKNKTTELDDKRLTLCRAKVAGDKSISVPPDENVEGTYPLGRGLALLHSLICFFYDCEFSSEGQIINIVILLLLSYLVTCPPVFAPIQTLLVLLLENHHPLFFIGPFL